MHLRHARPLRVDARRRPLRAAREGHWDYRFWVIFALAGWGASFLSGLFFLGPESGRIGKPIEERRGVDDEIGGRIERLLLYSRVELVLLALIAMDMVIKPGL